MQPLLEIIMISLLLKELYVRLGFKKGREGKEKTGKERERETKKVNPAS